MGWLHVPSRCWMLDIQQCTEVEILKIWYPGTGIQNQSMLRTVFASTVYILYMI